MKLLYLLATNGGWGGLEKHVFEMAGSMADRGHEVLVLCSKSYLEKCPERVRIEPFDWAASRNSPFLWYRLRRTLNKIAADVIHAQADKAAQVLSRAGWPSNSVAVATVHNVKTRYRAFMKMDALITVSQEIADQVPHKHISVVHNGVHTRVPEQVKLAELRAWLADKPRPVLLAVGRLVEAKGFDILLRAWPKAVQASLVILGEGKQRKELEQLIAQRELHHVYLIGESADVSEWMQCADILVISSRNEGGPYVLSEALLAGLPVVSTRVGMVPEFLPESCIVKPNDEREMTALLAAVLSDPGHYKAQNAPVINMAKQTLTQTAMMDNTEAFYHRTLTRLASS